MDVEPGSRADNQYMYGFDSNVTFTVIDGVGYIINAVYSPEVANIFTAHGNAGGYEKLTEVAFYTAEGAEYEVEVYVGLTDPMDPTSGEKVYSTNGKMSRTGLFNFSLDRTVYLSEGELFSVVVSCKNSAGDYCGVAQSSSDEYVGYGESFQAWDNGEGGFYWMEAATSGYKNNMIYAYTDDCAKKSKEATGLKLNASAITIEAPGDKAKLTAALTPVNSNTAVKYTSSNTSVATVDEAGNITSLAAGSCKITCTAGTLSAVCTVTVNKTGDTPDWIRNANSTEEWPTITGFSVSGITSQTAKLSWNADSEAETYFIMRRNKEAGCWEYVANVTTNYYKVEGLIKGTEYEYGIVGGRTLWGYAYSLSYIPATVTFTTDSTEVTNVTATIKGSTVVLKWNKITGATKYKVYRLSSDSDYEWKLVKTISKGTTVTFTDKNVETGESYMYRVYALKGKTVLTKGIPVTITVP